MDKFTPLAKILHCRRQISPLGIKDKRNQRTSVSYLRQEYCKVCIILIFVKREIIDVNYLSSVRSKSYFCVHNFSFSALSEQECVQCALFLIWSLSDLSDVTGVALHNCTGAVSSFYSLLIFQQRVRTALVAYMQRNSTHIVHAWTLPLHCAQVFSSWSDFGKLMPPTREQEEFFLHSSLSLLPRWLDDNYALQVQIGVQLDYGNN